VRAAATNRTYDRTLDRWTRAALKELGAVDAELGMAAADQVDGLWWDSRRRVPDERLVMRRAFDAASVVEPWTVGRSSPEARAWEQAHCAADAPPVLLRIPEDLGEIRFEDVATLEIRLDGTLRARISTAMGALTQSEFPRILEAIRAEARSEFGPQADRVER